MLNSTFLLQFRFVVLSIIIFNAICFLRLELSLNNFIHVVIEYYRFFMFHVNTQNVVHGDIKPDNLLVTAKGNVKIGDFSVSQIFKVFHFLFLQ